MRITNNIIQQTSISNVERNLRDLYKAQQQVTTGLRINKASDDPVGASTSMETRTSIRALDQFRRGIDIATSRATAEETVLDKVGDILMRIKEIGVAAANDSTTAGQREVAAIEVEELFREMISLANTKYGEGYLFNGTQIGTQPYESIVVAGSVDYTTTTPSGNFQIQVSASHSVPANHSGVEVFEDTNALGALRDLAIALRANDTEDILAELGSVDSAFDGVQNLLGAIGSQSSSLQITSANVEALNAGLQVLKSDTEEVDLEYAITELMSRQTSYQAALMTTSRIIGMTLADYLR